MELSAQKARYETIRSATAAAIIAGAGTYIPVGTVFDNPARIIKVLNLTDADILISYDGVLDHDIVGANGGHIIDFASDKSNQAGVMEQPAKTQVYVKNSGAAPTVKSIYITVIYASTV